MFDINNFVVDRVIRGSMIMPSTGDIAWSVNQVESPSLKCTGDTTDAVDAITINEIQNFIDKVVDESYVNIIEYRPMNTDIAFSIYFLSMFTDMVMPTHEVNGEVIIDKNRAYKIITSLNMDNNIMSLLFASKIREYIDKTIEYRNKKNIAYASSDSATSEAIETFSYAMNKLVNLLNKGTELLEIGKEKLSDGLSDGIVQNVFTNLFQNVNKGETV